MSAALAQAVAIFARAKKAQKITEDCDTAPLVKIIFGLYFARIFISFNLLVLSFVSRLV